MTVGEREEESNTSNMKMEEDEEHINVRLNDSNDEQFQIGSSNSQNQIEKAPINEESKDDEESERSKKRSRITESTTNKEEEEEEEEFDTSDLGQDPLVVTEEIVSKYYDFITYVYQILKEYEQKKDEQMNREELKMEWQKWCEILARGEILVKTVNHSLRIVKLDMECMESIEDFEKQYRFRKAHIPNMLSMLRHINSRIESSTNFRFVSDMKNRRKVLPMCLRELERCKGELSGMMGVIKVLKELDLKLEDDDDDDDDETK